LWRCVFFSSQKQPAAHPLNTLFTAVDFIEPSPSESLAVLKSYRADLENFHHILISDESFSAAISFTKHYLAGSPDLDKAYELLDSAAARITRLGLPEQGQKPTLAPLHLAQVVSSWTAVPLSHLQNNQFQALHLLEALQRTVFGQDAALHSIASVLQSACIKLNKKPGPLCSFLFIGASGSGKALLAHAMAEHLFGHKAALLRVCLEHQPNGLGEMTVRQQFHESHLLSLFTALQKTPYAILLIENIEKISVPLLQVLTEIILHGYAFDTAGNKYNFRNTIIIMTTTVGQDCIPINNPIIQDDNKTIDLLQLVLEQHVPDQAPQQLFSLQELPDGLLTSLTTLFSDDLLQHVTVVPFVPLDAFALEKIIFLKLKELEKRLNANFDLTFRYAPEVIKFLAHEIIAQRTQHRSLEKILEKQLYACITHEIITHHETKNKPNHLLLQVNENGHVLRCEFFSTSEVHV